MKENIAWCLNNDGYEASLTMDNSYEVIEDSFADENNLIRIKDNTGEAYYYDRDAFYLQAVGCVSRNVDSVV
jgi:hypothetical protein